MAGNLGEDFDEGRPEVRRRVGRHVEWLEVIQLLEPRGVLLRVAGELSFGLRISYESR